MLCGINKNIDVSNFIFNNDIEIDQSVIQDLTMVR